MYDLIENLSNNNSVIIGLSIIVGLLVLLFFFVLFTGKKNKKVEINDDNIEPVSEANDLDFDHEEYVKETTAEFELTPIEDIKPTLDEYVPEVKEEESPAININADAEEIPLKDFSFDELSRSIAAELDRLKEEKKSQVKVEEKDEESKDYEVINPFNDETIFKPFKVSNIEDMINDENKEEPKEEKATFKVNEDIFKREESSEPVLKDEETPLFARFNQETYDISNKD